MRVASIGSMRPSINANGPRLQLKPKSNAIMSKPKTKAIVGKPKTHLHHKLGPSSPTQAQVQCLHEQAQDNPHLFLGSFNHMLFFTSGGDDGGNGDERRCRSTRSWSKLQRLRAGASRALVRCARAAVSPSWERGWRALAWEMGMKVAMKRPCKGEGNGFGTQSLVVKEKIKSIHAKPCTW